MADIIIPCIGSHYFDCKLFVKLFWFLHPVLNYLSLYTMIFMRQYFTFRALRETRLKNFIPVEITVISVRLYQWCWWHPFLSPKPEISHPDTILSFVYHSHSVLFLLDLHFGCSFHQTIWSRGNPTLRLKKTV